jgi:hypothetical protein
VRSPRPPPHGSAGVLLAGPCGAVRDRLRGGAENGATRKPGRVRVLLRRGIDHAARRPAVAPPARVGDTRLQLVKLARRRRARRRASNGRARHRIKNARSNQSREQIGNDL